MNVEISAANRTIRIADCHSAPEECAGFALELWQETEPVPEETVGAGFGLQTEREYRPSGFVDVSAGERLEVK